MCLGGVMGSLECAVDENTKNIYIEAASFDGATIRRTSNRLGLASESSSRFVKGTNHFQADFVLNFAAELIGELCEAKEFSNIVTYQSEKIVYKDRNDLDKKLKKWFLKYMTNRNAYYERVMGISKPYKVHVKKMTTRYGSNSYSTHSISQW